MSIDLQGDVVFEVDAIGWAPSGARTALSLHHELDPARLPAANKGAATVGGHERTPSGRYVLATGLADEEDGLCQAITPGALKPRVTYRVAGWIRLGEDGADAGAAEGATGHAVRVNIRLDEDDGCVVEGGAICAVVGKWTEIKGAFRLKKSPCAAEVYVQGAPAGVDVKVMDLQVFATDRKARFRKLRKKTDKVSK